MMRAVQRSALFAIAVFVATSYTIPVAAQMTDTLPQVEQLEESLVGTTWSGHVFGQRFDYYLLDDHLLIYRTKGEVFAKSKWQMRRDGRLFIALLNNPHFRLELNFEGDVSGNTITGTAKHIVKVLPTQETEESPWRLEKLPAPIPELVAAVPGGRSVPAPLPKIKVSDFEGVYTGTFPEREGQSSPTIAFELTCKAAAGCALKGNNVSREVFDKVAPLGRSGLSQAKFALQYAKEHRSQAIQQEPWLATLLESNADISNCFDLGKRQATYAGGDMPGMNVLCRLDKNPWKKPVVLYMGTILANCGPAFCRFGLMPLFR